MKIYWKSWSPLEAQFELDRLKTLNMKNLWIDGNQNTNIGPKDLYLSTNGYNYKAGNFKKACLYWEGYTYLKNEYKNYDHDHKWNHRFHFNPEYARKTNSSLLPIGCYWNRELKDYEDIKSTKKIEHTFGMVLGFKTKGIEDSDIGWLRQKIVEAGKNRSFKYFGTGWPQGDPNYGGEKYVAGCRNSPIKFNDARKLVKGAKFVFTIENTFHPVYSQGYLTEKIFHGFLSCSVPIYIGCFNIEKMIPDNIFIDFRKFDLNPTKVMDFCEKMTTSDYNGYLDRINKWLGGAGKMFSCESRFMELDKEITRIFGA